MVQKSILGQFKADMELVLSQKSKNELFKAVKDLEKKFLIKIDTGNAKRKFTDLIEKVTDAGLKTFTTEISSGLEKAADTFEKSQLAGIKNLHKLDRGLQQKNLTEAQRNKIKIEIRDVMTLMNNEKKLYKLRVKGDTKRFNELYKMSEKFTEEFGEGLWGGIYKGVSGFAGDLVEGVEEAFNKVKSGDLKGFFSTVSGGISKKLKAVGEHLQVIGAKSGSAGIEGLGAVVTGLGAAIGIIGGVVLAFGALLAMVVEVDSRAKQFNKTLVTGVGGLDIYASGVGTIRENLNNLRKTITNMDLQWETGKDAKELATMIGEFSQAGITVRSLQGDITGYGHAAIEAGKAQKELGRHLSNLSATANMVGLSTSEVATSFGDYMDELGVSLDTIEEKFDGIAKMAMNAGFSTRRFYSMVIQATAGMATYNVRIEHVANMLTKMTKILGQKEAANFLQGFTKRFSGMSAQDRIKAHMIIGSKRAQGDFQRSAERTAEGFFTEFLKRGQTESGAENRHEQGAKVLAAHGIDTETPDKMMAQMARMNATQRAQIVSDLQGAGEAGMARQIQTLNQNIAGMTGGLNAWVSNVESLDLGAQMTATMQQAGAFTGGNVNGVMGAAVSEQLGLDPETRHLYNRVMETVHGDIANMKEIASGQQQMSEKEQNRRFGAHVVTRRDSQGRETQHAITELGHDLGDLNDRSNATAQAFVENYVNQHQEDLQTPATSIEALNEQIVANTLDISTKIDMGVTHYLELISGYAQGILQFLGLQGDPAATAARQQATDMLVRRSEAAMRDVSTIPEKIAKIQEKLRTGKYQSLQDREAARAEITNLEQQRTQRLAQSQAATQLAAAVARQRGSGSSEDQIHAALGSMDWDTRQATRQSLGIDTNITNEQRAAAREQFQRELDSNIHPTSNVNVMSLEDSTMRSSAVRGNQADLDRLIMQNRDIAFGLPGAPGATPTPGVPGATVAPTVPGAPAAPGAPVVTETGAPPVAQIQAAAQPVELGTVPVVEAVHALPTVEMAERISATATNEIVTELKILRKEFKIKYPGIWAPVFRKAFEESFPETIAVAVADEFDERQFEKFLRSVGYQVDMQTAINDYMGRGEDSTRYQLNPTDLNQVRTALAATQGTSTVGSIIGAPAISATGLGPGMAEPYVTPPYVTPPHVTPPHVTPTAHDFIYRGDGSQGVITPIDTADQFFGAKAGGPIANAMGGSVTIHINGGDEQRIFQVVQRAMREMGVAPSRGTSNA